MPKTALPTVHEIAQLIDHALLKPDLTRDELFAGLKQAAAYDIYSVCVRPADVKLAKLYLQEYNPNVRVGTVVGFPHGSSTTATKVFETIDALGNGAVEIDFVINIAELKSGQPSPVIVEMRQIVAAAKEHGAEKTKAIFETAYLTDDEIKMAALLAHSAGVDFVKTSTGFAHGGATVEHLRLMREAAPAPTEVKASGGVRDLDTLLAMRALGVTRFGTSATKVILDELQRRQDGESMLPLDLDGDCTGFRPEPSDLNLIKSEHTVAPGSDY
jgi:deoxyribose-phosphate aldolase